MSSTRVRWLPIHSQLTGLPEGGPVPATANMCGHSRPRPQPQDRTLGNQSVPRFHPERQVAQLMLCDGSLLAGADVQLGPASHQRP
jgi:hypothetical protein